MKTIIRRLRDWLKGRAVRRFAETRLGDVGPLDWSALVGEMEGLGLRLRWHRSGATLSLVGNEKRWWTVSFTRFHTVAELRREARWRMGLETGTDAADRVPWGQRLLLALGILVFLVGLGAAVWLGGLFMSAETLGRMDGDGREWTGMDSVEGRVE